MTETVIRLIKLLLYMLPFLLFALLNMKANLEKQYRSRQFLMPVLTLVYCILLMIFLERLNTWLLTMIRAVPGWLSSLAAWLSSVLGGALRQLANAVSSLSEMLHNWLERANLTYLVFFVSNTLFLLVHIILKRILAAIMKAAFRSGNRLHDFCVGPFYEMDGENGLWHVRSHMGQARTLLRTLYFTALALSIVAVLVTCELYRKELLSVPFCPVFGLLVVGELYFFLDGLTRQEMAEMLTGEADRASSVSNYALLRPVLSRLIGDKLSAEDTTVDNDLIHVRTHDEILLALEQNDDVMTEAYGRFMRIRAQHGLELDHSYLASGLELLRGNSILFNDPFCYDLIPYVSYPMNRVLLRRQKVLIVLGRHDSEKDAEAWCREGLAAVTGVPSLWNIGVLADTPQKLDVGIVTRSSVHDFALHEANSDFFREVEMVVIIEPSKLVATAQIGLNSLVRRCQKSGKRLTFCSIDKNCDGLVDSLSHILLTSLTEVSATGHHKGTSSYMCWEADGDHLQHRLLPNLSRYLGMGTELSFAALKNQVSRTEWYGGEAFPVVDIHWIASQYYYDLLRYAGLPTSQDAMDEYFRVSPNLWSARVKKNHYITVEDESCNLFEMKREFSTRATEQGFVNILSPEYLLRDYMTENDGIFTADPKAIPCIVADYAPTKRNVALRLCLRMSAGPVSEKEIRQELKLVDVNAEDLHAGLWHEICVCCLGAGSTAPDGENREILTVEIGGVQAAFTSDVLRTRRKFSMESGQMEEMYFITDAKFISLLLDDLQSAEYIAEDEKDGQQYLGTELRGHVFQKYLPGQFFTLGGKYYEMLRVTSGGQVLVRRAADHITGRPAYRQVRRYALSNVSDSALMGDKVDINGLQIAVQYADIRVDTPAYWHMEKYNDFAGGRKVTLGGIPQRVYRGKQVLCITLPGTGLTNEIRCTIALLFNEVFRTLFAENHAFLAAVTPGEPSVPSTYSICGENGFEPETDCVYIIEDSQLDLGLLVAVRRNLDRIFSILCDYLGWHMDAMEKSLNPPPAPAPPDFTADPDTAEQKPQNAFGRAVKKVKEFFSKVFRQKPRKEKKRGVRDEKDAAPAAADEPIDSGSAHAPDVPEAETAVKEAQTEPPAREPQTAAGEETPPLTGAEEFVPAPPEQPSEGVGKEEKPTAQETDAEALDPAAAGEEIADGETQPKPGESQESAGEESDGAGETLVLMSTEADRPAERPTSEEISFEPDGARQIDGLSAVRKPYHERCYLLYGGDRVPTGIDVAGTHSYLEALGYGSSELKQARDGVDTADQMEKGFCLDAAGKKYCDFCGAELVGTEYEILLDGRERCMMCSRTAVQTEEEFKDIYKTVIRNLELFFGIRITVPVQVEMVNAKKLHKRLGKSFVPTSKPDGRVLGVAIRSKGGYSILLENGAPRIQSMLTMAHELIHIWQYLNWDRKAILSRYGKEQELEVYEGMAKWGEIQYAYLIGESAAAKREELITQARQDEYGRGFCKYAACYPLSTGTGLKGSTPFQDVERPL